MKKKNKVFENKAASECRYPSKRKRESSVEKMLARWNFQRTNAAEERSEEEE